MEGRSWWRDFEHRKPFGFNPHLGPLAVEVRRDCSVLHLLQRVGASVHLGPRTVDTEIGSPMTSGRSKSTEPGEAAKPSTTTGSLSCRGHGICLGPSTRSIWIPFPPLLLEATTTLRSSATACFGAITCTFPTSAPTNTAAHLMFGRWHDGPTKRIPLGPLQTSKATRKSLAGVEASACASDGPPGLLPKRTFMRNGHCLQSQTKERLVFGRVPSMEPKAHRRTTFKCALHGRTSLLLCLGLGRMVGG